MNAKDYLSQARFLDMTINSKIEQLESLNSLATKATATLSDMPHNPNRGTSSLEDTICKIIDLQDEINRDIDALVDLKREIIHRIKKIDNSEYQALLELRYLSFLSWERISVDMNISMQHAFRLHDRAIENFSQIYEIGE